MAAGAVAARRGRLPVWLISLGLAIGILAAVPVAGFAWNSLTADSQSPETPFADAPAGNYVVVARLDDSTAEDIISIVPAGNPAGAMEIIRVPHLDGYLSHGSVSPDGTKLALVVADAGTVGRPGASLMTIDLLTGEAFRLAIAVDVLQEPLWTPDSSAVVVTRTAASESTSTDVTISAIAADLSGEVVVASATGVFGAYPVAFTPEGELVWVSIGGAGSTAYRGAGAGIPLTANFSRDWALSPDGLSLAFVEVLPDGGVRYEGRIANLDPAAIGGSSVAATGDEQANGVAWQPGTAVPVFGTVAGIGAAGVDGGTGIDVPLAWAPDGSALAVQSWSGSTFDEPGAPVLAVASASGEVPLDGYLAFYGWAVK